MADLSQFKEAAAAVKHSPHAVSAWEEVEALAADLDKPDDIVALYNETLARQRRAAGRRDDRRARRRLLRRVVRRRPEGAREDPRARHDARARSDTALQRLSRDLHRRRALGRRARALRPRGRARPRTSRAACACSAKPRSSRRTSRTSPTRRSATTSSSCRSTPDDGADQPEPRAPARAPRALGRSDRAVGGPPREPVARRIARRSRARIASVWLDNLHDPQRALAAAKPLLAEADDDKESCALLERIIESPKATTRRARRRARSAALALRRDVAPARGDPRPRDA